MRPAEERFRFDVDAFHAHSTDQISFCLSQFTVCHLRWMRTIYAIFTFTARAEPNAQTNTNSFKCTITLNRFLNRRQDIWWMKRGETESIFCRFSLNGETIRYLMRWTHEHHIFRSAQQMWCAKIFRNSEIERSFARSFDEIAILPFFTRSHLANTSISTFIDRNERQKTPMKLHFAFLALHTPTHAVDDSHSNLVDVEEWNAHTRNVRKMRRYLQVSRVIGDCVSDKMSFFFGTIRFERIHFVACFAIESKLIRAMRFSAWNVTIRRQTIRSWNLVCIDANRSTELKYFLFGFSCHRIAFRRCKWTTFCQC